MRLGDVEGEWRRELADTFGTAEASFVGVPTSRFTTKAVEPGRATISLSGGIKRGKSHRRVFLDDLTGLRKHSHNQTLRAGATLLL